MATFGSRNLRKGSTGSDVRELQTKLNSIGFDCGKVDGIFGTKTLSAVKRFQQRYNLAVDGIVGKNTYKKLAEVLAGQQSQSSTGGQPSAVTVVQGKPQTSTVTLVMGEAPAVVENELRVAIQTKVKTSTTMNMNTTTSASASGDTVTSTTTTTTATESRKIFYPPIEGDVTWDTERTGTPGKVTFKTRGDADFTEGDMVSLKYGNTDVFIGYIFDRKTDKTGAVEVTAYDQTRYFKNPDTYVFEDKSASEVLQRIANDYQMAVGTIEDTGVTFDSIVEDNQPLFDIVCNALNKTTMVNNTQYVFYDDCGKLMLRSLDSMRVNLLLCEDTVENYDYTSSIDDDTYNQIILYYDNKETNEREYFTSSSEANIKQWGILRKSESVTTPEGAQKLASDYLTKYNQKTRKLSVKNAFGRPDVRAGTLVPVKMKVGEINIANFMLVEKASHKWSNGTYYMDLDLAGAGGFSV